MVTLNLDEAVELKYTIEEVIKMLPNYGDLWVYDVDTDKMHYPNANKWTSFALHGSEDYWITHSLKDGDLSYHSTSPKTYVSDIKNAHITTE